MSHPLFKRGNPLRLTEITSMAEVNAPAMHDEALRSAHNAHARRNSPMDRALEAIYAAEMKRRGL